MSPLEMFVPEPNSGCWLWIGAINHKGYGMYQREGKRVMAHRVVYRALRGEPPAGLQPDHLCRVPSCVNPQHLEWVTSRENTMRGIGPTATYAKRTMCSRGHPYMEGTFYLFRGTNRRCRLCEAIHKRKRRAKALAALAAMREA